MRGYPTIKFFPAGDKSGDAEEYDGGRTSSSIVSWALDKFASDLPPPEVFEVTNCLPFCMSSVVSILWFIYFNCWLYMSASAVH